MYRYRHICSVCDDDERKALYISQAGTSAGESYLGNGGFVFLHEFIHVLLVLLHARL